jgi:hypothetical protein
MEHRFFYNHFIHNSLAMQLVVEFGTISVLC